MLLDSAFACGSELTLLALMRMFIPFSSRELSWVAMSGIASTREMSPGRLLGLASTHFLVDVSERGRGREWVSVCVWIVLVSERGRTGSYQSTSLPGNLAILERMAWQGSIRHNLTLRRKLLRHRLQHLFFPSDDVHPRSVGCQCLCGHQSNPAAGACHDGYVAFHLEEMGALEMRGHGGVQRSCYVAMNVTRTWI